LEFAQAAYGQSVGYVGGRSEDLKKAYNVLAKNAMTKRRKLAEQGLSKFLGDRPHMVGKLEGLVLLDQANVAMLNEKSPAVSVITYSDGANAAIKAVYAVASKELHRGAIVAGELAVVGAEALANKLQGGENASKTR
jgi:hypothetical protein